MKKRTLVIAVLVIVVGLPLGAALTAVVSFSILNKTNGTIVSSGKSREYLLYVPRTYNRSKPTALVISLHALGLWPAAQMALSHWNQLADEDGFIVVYPSGTGLPKIWRMKPEGALASDVIFVADLIDKLASEYSIDPTRVYANGFSNGGGMSFVLSCRLAGRIAAVGTVGAAEVLPASWCVDPAPMPMIAFHGTADRIVPYNGGPSAFFDIPFPAAPDWAATWARRNGCMDKASDSLAAANISLREYKGCVEDADVMLYTVQGGGHSWPGGTLLPEWIESRTTDIDATRATWAFFRRHRRPLR